MKICHSHEMFCVFLTLLSEISLDNTWHPKLGYAATDSHRDTALQGWSQVRKRHSHFRSYVIMLKHLF